MKRTIVKEQYQCNTKKIGKNISHILYGDQCEILKPRQKKQKQLDNVLLFEITIIINNLIAKVLPSKKFEIKIHIFINIAKIGS
jgi:hypothetical protein